MRRGSWFVISVLILGGAVLLVTPTDLSAAGSTEVERHHYLCPVDPVTLEVNATSLSECSWEGMYFKPCTGTSFIEGTLTGNYKITVATNCTTSNSWNTCFLGFSCEWVEIGGEYKWLCASYLLGSCLDD